MSANLLLFAFLAILAVAYLVINSKSVKVYEGAASLKYKTGKPLGGWQLVSVFTDGGSWVVSVPAGLTKIDGLEKVRVTITRTFNEAPEIGIEWLGVPCSRDYGDVYVS